MKKFSLSILAAALLIGSIFSGGCGFAGFNGFAGDGVQGSGILKSEQRAVSGFSKVEVGGAIRIEVTAQKDFSVSVEADDNVLPLIKTEVSGDTLKIYREKGSSSKVGVKVTISMPDVKAINLSGASTAFISGAKTDSLELEASGASKIKIDGEAKDLNSDASGASGIDAENLRVENADVEASGASSTTISAIDELKADASGASTIYYTGEPKNINQKSSGASSVKKK